MTGLAKRRGKAASSESRRRPRLHVSGYPSLLTCMLRVARVTGLEPATSGVTGRRSNQLSYTRLQSVRRD